MQNHPALRKLTPAMVYLNALIWIGLGIIIGLNLHPALPKEPLFRWGMTLLMLLTGSSMIILFQLSQRWRHAYYLLIGMFAVISILAFMDDFGLVDLAALAINVLALVLLIVSRSGYQRS